MLALLAHQRLLCSGCGGYLPETTQSENEVQYIAENPMRCLRCTAISMKAKSYSENEAPEALRYPTRRHLKGGT